MSRTLTEEHSERLAELLIRMGVNRETRLEVLVGIETPQECKAFLDILSENNYEMMSEGVYQAMVEALEETASL